VQAHGFPLVRITPAAAQTLQRHRLKALRRPMRWPAQPEDAVAIKSDAARRVLRSATKEVETRNRPSTGKTHVGKWVEPSDIHRAGEYMSHYYYSAYPGGFQVRRNAAGSPRYRGRRPRCWPRSRIAPARPLARVPTLRRPTGVAGSAAARGLLGVLRGGGPRAEDLLARPAAAEAEERRGHRHAPAGRDRGLGGRLPGPSCRDGM
jgi:hypothetical protein